MKRLLALAVSLVLLAGCGTAVPPEAETTIEETTILEITIEETTTQAPESIQALASKPKNPDAKPFTKGDIDVIESQFKTVGDYVKAAPAAWYKVDHWDAYGCEIFVEFYDHQPNEGSVAFLRLQLRDETLCDIIEYKYTELLQELPKVLLDAEKAAIREIDFAKAGDAITPPRGIKIGGPAQKIFDSYPDYRTGDKAGFYPGQDEFLYDITAIYPDAKPEWGEWDGEGWDKYGFLGGCIMMGYSPRPPYAVVSFTFMNPP